MIISPVLIRNQNIRSVMTTINDDVDMILLYCVFNRSPKHKYIPEDRFESFEKIMSLNENYIGNISKGFLERTEANGRDYITILPNLYTKSNIPLGARITEDQQV